MLGDIRKQDKTRPKLGLVDQKLQEEPRKISSESPACVAEGWLLQTSLHNWINIVKKLSTSTVMRRPFEAGIYGRIAVKKPLFRKQNNFKTL